MNVAQAVEGAASSGSLLREFTAARRQFELAGRADLCEWVDKEIAGYGQARRLPAYRWVPAVARGTVTMADGTTLDAHQLPVSHLSDDWTRERVRQGLAEIEALAISGHACVSQEIAQGELAAFARGLGLSAARITHAWWEIRTPDLKAVLDGARAELHRLLASLPAGHRGP
jgi:hypothetical protein